MRSERAVRRLSGVIGVPTMSAGGSEMALWSFVQCRRCGYAGCAAPIGEGCPRCGQPLEPEPEPTDDQPASH